MKVRVLGCHGAQLPGHRSCGFLINESVLLDAGTVSGSLGVMEQSRIRCILLSHIHMDHIKGLASFSENRIPDNERNPVVIVSLEDVLDGLKRWVFNDQVWPNFAQLPSDQDPVFRLQPIKEGESIKIEGLEITAFSVNHIVPCAGFIVRQNHASFLYSGDTYQTETIWQAAAKDAHLKAALIETTFPNALEDLAVKSKHLTPRLLSTEFAKIGKPALPLYVYHVKPRYLDVVRRELDALRIENMTMLQDETILDIG